MKHTNKLGVGIRITEDFDNTLEILGWMPDKVQASRYGTKLEYRITTKRGIIEIGRIGDWIVCSDSGDYNVYTNEEMERVNCVSPVNQRISL